MIERNVLITILILIYSSCQVPKNKEDYIVYDEFEIKDSIVLDLRDKIAANNVVESSHIGAAGSPSEQFKNYENLLEIASEKELFQLTKDENFVVATYAAFGLVDSDSPLFVNVFKHFLKNDTLVRTIKGCLMGNDLVSSEIYHHYWGKLILTTDNEKLTLQNDRSLLRLDSLVLVSNNANWLLYNRAFNNRKFSSDYLPLIERHAFKNKNIDAIEYLFQKNQFIYEEQIVEVLTSFLKNDVISPSIYDKIFPMLLSYEKEDLNKLLILELKEINKELGEGKAAKYRNLLTSHNVKI